MRQPVGWIGLACLALLHCSSSVTDTRAPRDAAVDAPPDAVDFTRPPPALNPCAPERIVDLDRVGLSTGRGLGVVLEHATAPEVQIGPTGPGSCARLYRPVVLRVRAPRAGMLFVSLPRQPAPTAIVRARRMERCDASGSAIACDASTPYCMSEALCGELLGPVADGQGVDIGIGMETAHPRGLVVTPGRIAVSVTVLPTLPAGAVCDERRDRWHPWDEPKWRNHRQIVPRDGVEPPTRGFSIHAFKMLKPLGIEVRETNRKRAAVNVQCAAGTRAGFPSPKVRRAAPGTSPRNLDPF